MVGLVLGAAITAVCLSPPVDGEVTKPFAPSGSYAGHWGVDFEANYGEAVVAPSSGRVTFAGSVAGMRSVTIQPVPGYKISISYLSEIGVRRGDWVHRGHVVGRAGLEDGMKGVHLSTRINGSYVPDGSARMHEHRYHSCAPLGDASAALSSLSCELESLGGHSTRFTSRTFTPESRLFTKLSWIGCSSCQRVTPGRRLIGTSRRPTPGSR